MVEAERIQAEDYRTIRPGLLVALRSGVVGNIKYDRIDIEEEHLTAEGTKEARWETQKVIEDPAEHDEAAKVRAKALSTIRGQCARSAFGLLCPENNEANLKAAIQEANRIVAAFNARAQLTRVLIYAITGRIAPDDVQAVRAIKGEIRDLMTNMQDGIKNLDVKAVRDAANAARSVGQMLSPAAQERVKDAIDTARKVAREIVKAGEQATIEVDRAAIKKITEARTAFLDLEYDDVAQPVPASKAKGRAVELEPEAEAAPPVAKETTRPRRKAAARQLELDA